MTSFQLFEAIGNIDDTLIAEVSNSSFNKTKKFYTISVLAACAVLAICVFANFEKIHQINTDNRANEIVYQTPTVTLQGNAREEAIDNVVINKIDSLYSNAKFGGKLKQVSERQWQKQYGTEDFLKAHKKKYKFSFSDAKKILYGVVELELPNNQVVDIIASNGEMLDSSFKELKKTLIGNSEVAICKINNGNFCAIVYGKNAVYTIEGDEKMNKNQFIMLLKKILK